MAAEDQHRVKIERAGWSIILERWPMIDEALAEEWRHQFAAMTPKPEGVAESEVPEESRLPVQLLPEMIFDRNTIRFEFPAADFGISLSVYNALKEWAQHPLKPMKVAAAKQWAQHRTEFGSDPTIEWTFSTKYRGDFTFLSKDGEVRQPNTEKEYQIDFDLLKRQDPILLFCELMLFEDELADNGTSTLSCKIRVMPTCFFVLMRFWCRVDDVAFRVFDTRIFHKFGTKEVVRDFQWHESTFDELRANGKLPSDPTSFSDENLMLQRLEKKQHITDGFDLQ